MKALKASCGTTGSEGVAVAGFPSSAGGQTEAKVLPQGQEAPASSEQVGAEKPAQEGQPEASVVQEEELDLLGLLMVCFGFQESIFQQMPEHGSGGH